MDSRRVVPGSSMMISIPSGSLSAIGAIRLHGALVIAPTSQQRFIPRVALSVRSHELSSRFTSMTVTQAGRSPATVTVRNTWFHGCAEPPDSSTW